MSMSLPTRMNVSFMSLGKCMLHIQVALGRSSGRISGECEVIYLVLGMFETKWRFFLGISVLMYKFFS